MTYREAPPAVYMDNHATTRVDPRVVEAMLPYFAEDYGNAGSVGHLFGERAKAAADCAQESIAATIGAQPRELLFTSGATESNNLAIRGVAERPRRRGKHLVSVATEHKAVLDPLSRLAKQGYEVTLLDVEPAGSGKSGWLDPVQVEQSLRDDTCLVSVMLANNEIGVIHPLEEIAAICKRHGVLLHCDATQAVGKIPVDVRELNVDLMSFSAHKLYGPKGIGALFVRSRNPIVRLEAQITGGGQQAGRRSGTLNVAGMVGFATAVDIALEELPAEMIRLADLRNRLVRQLTGLFEDVHLCGPSLEESSLDGGLLRLPGNANLIFGGLDGEALLMAMGNLAVSSGATCSSSDPDPSHVLRALGYSDEAARSSLRFGLGRFNSADDIDFAVETVSQAVRRLRSLATT